jgi:hypothetical protein
MRRDLSGQEKQLFENQLSAISQSKTQVCDPLLLIPRYTDFRDQMG